MYLSCAAKKKKVISWSVHFLLIFFFLHCSGERFNRKGLLHSNNEISIHDLNLHLQGRDYQHSAADTVKVFINVCNASLWLFKVSDSTHGWLIGAAVPHNRANGQTCCSEQHCTPLRSEHSDVHSTESAERKILWAGLGGPDCPSRNVLCWLWRILSFSRIAFLCWRGTPCAFPFKTNWPTSTRFY